ISNFKYRLFRCNANENTSRAFLGIINPRSVLSYLVFTIFIYFIYGKEKCKNKWEKINKPCIRVFIYLFIILFNIFNRSKSTSSIFYYIYTCLGICTWWINLC